jgi:hypothetical protein
MIDSQKLIDANKLSREKAIFYIDSKFWSKPSISELDNWLNNFKTSEEKYCAYKLINRLVYYSESDIIRLLDFTLYEKIFKRRLLNLEIESQFSISKKELQSLKNDFKNDLRIIPLSTGDQSESSLAILRHLTNDLGISNSLIINFSNSKSEDLENCKNLIIVDDFIGSGTQIKTFWNTQEIVIDGKRMFLNQIKKMFPNIEIDYMCLVTTCFDPYKTRVLFYISKIN